MKKLIAPIVETATAVIAVIIAVAALVAWLA